MISDSFYYNDLKNLCTIIHFQNMNYLESSLQGHRDLMKKHGWTFQPLIVAVGDLRNLQACYVVINTTKYLFQSLLAAVDFCFKSFYALKLEYPLESRTVWSFFDNYVYKIPGSKCHTAVGTLIWQLFTS